MSTEEDDQDVEDFKNTLKRNERFVAYLTVFGVGIVLITLLLTALACHYLAMLFSHNTIG